MASLEGQQGGSAGAKAMNRARFLRVLGATEAAWAKRYSIEPFEHPCSSCGKTLRTSEPIAYQTFRGLEAPPCSCGNVNTPWCIVRAPGHGDLFT